MGGINLLTDPIWSERASPVVWAGPRRRRPPGIRFEDLPPIDVVLLSHNHYDHLDLPTLERLAQAHRPQFLVPLGNSPFLASRGIGPVIELD
jgi:L-ascorbate metabolism protein UlaG (beta-lactamase superfamily)